MQAAAVAAEDIGFLTHEGVDWTAVREALQEWVEGEGLRGASTITQQTARNLFLSSRRSFFRKVAEARIARALEDELGKRRILELYLNIAEFGDEVLGVEAAAWRYYGCTAAELTAEQAVGLCAALPSPRRDNPATATRTWEFRSEVILKRLEEYDWLYRRLLRLHPEDVAEKLAAAIAEPDTTLPLPADTTSAAPPDTARAKPRF